MKTINLLSVLVFTLFFICIVYPVQNWQHFKEKISSLGYSTCGKCDRPWKYVEGHNTMFTENRGCFPLCKKCWEDLKTPQKRLPYYKSLWEEWGADHAEWEDIKKAVINET